PSCSTLEDTEIDDRALEKLRLFPLASRRFTENTRGVSQRAAFAPAARESFFAAVSARRSRMSSHRGGGTRGRRGARARRARRGNGLTFSDTGRQPRAGRAPYGVKFAIFSDIVACGGVLFHDWKVRSVTGSSWAPAPSLAMGMKA